MAIEIFRCVYILQLLIFYIHIILATVMYANRTDCEYLAVSFITSWFNEIVIVMFMLKNKIKPPNVLKILILFMAIIFSAITTYQVYYYPYVYTSKNTLIKILSSNKYISDDNKTFSFNYVFDVINITILSYINLTLQICAPLTIMIALYLIGRYSSQKNENNCTIICSCTVSNGDTI